MPPVVDASLTRLSSCTSSPRHHRANRKSPRARDWRTSTQQVGSWYAAIAGRHRPRVPVRFGSGRNLASGLATPLPALAVGTARVQACVHGTTGRGPSAAERRNSGSRPQADAYPSHTESVLEAGANPNASNIRRTRLTSRSGCVRARFGPQAWRLKINNPAPRYTTQRPLTCGFPLVRGSVRRVGLTGFEPATP